MSSLEVWSGLWRGELQWDGTTLATVVIAVLSTLYLALYRLQTIKKHPDEPPIVAASVPFVGHLLGMALQGGRYIKGLG